MRVGGGRGSGGLGHRIGGSGLGTERWNFCEGRGCRFRVPLYGSKHKMVSTPLHTYHLVPDISST